MTLADACKTGSLKWLKQQKAAETPGDVTTTRNIAVQWAATNRHLDVVKWLVEESGQRIDVVSLELFGIPKNSDCYNYLMSIKKHQEVFGIEN